MRGVMITKQGTEDKSNRGYNKSRRSVLSVRVDLRSLASVLEYLNEIEIYPQSRSELVHYAIECLSSILKDSDRARNIPTVSEAVKVMKKRGMTWGEGENKDQLNRVLANESLSFGSIEKADPKIKQAVETVRAYELFCKGQGFSNTEELLEQTCEKVGITMDLYREFYSKREEFTFDSDSESQPDGGEIVETGTKKIDSKENMTKEELEAKARAREQEDRDKLRKMAGVPESVKKVED